MAIITAKVDDKLVKKFRHILYTKYGLRKGDFKKGLEEAMLDYIQKYSEPGSEVDRLAETAKSIQDNDEES